MVVILLVYIDDILVISNLFEAVSLVKRTLHDLFKIKDLGEAKYLVIEATRTNRVIHLTGSMLWTC